MATPNY